MFFILEAVEKQRGIVSLADDWESVILKLCIAYHSHFHLSISCLKGLSNLSKCRFSFKLTVDVTLVFHAVHVYSKTVELIKFL